MIIILKRIPRHTRKPDIVEFLTPTLEGRIFQKSGSVESIKIQALHHLHSNAIELHALVVIHSDTVAERVIKKLNRKELSGKNIGIAEYVSRSWHNDPRINTDKSNFQATSKRVGNRRQANLQNITTSSEPDFSSEKNFHRKL